MIANIAAYHFVDITDPDVVCASLRTRAQSLQLRGTVLVAPEGINLFLAAAREQVQLFLDELLLDPRFQGLQVKWSESRELPFARLKVKRKREIISFRRDGCTPLGQRAPSVAPGDLARWIEQGADDSGRRLVLLDTRNREEMAHGSFRNAMRLPIDKFTDLPAALAGRADDFAGAALVSFCTGGIRCEKAALWMQAHGFPNALQLDGGILGYFEQVGGFGYDGNCFVFDERIALRPDLTPLRDQPVAMPG